MTIIEKYLAKIEHAFIKAEKQYAHEYTGLVQRLLKNEVINYGRTQVAKTGEPVPLKHMLQEYKNYLEGKSSIPIKLNFLDYSSEKVIGNFILREKPNDLLLGKIIDSALGGNTYYGYKSQQYDWLFKATDLEYSKKIALNLLDDYKKEKEAYHSVCRFSDIIQYYSKFKFEKDQYSKIKGFLDYYKTDIRNNEKALSDFLKSSIPAQEWHNFASYFSKPIGVIKTTQSLFEDKLNPTFNLIIYHNTIKSNYPAVSFEEDLNFMLGQVIKTVGAYGENLGISEAFISATYQDSTQSHFISKDMDYPLTEKLKETLSTMFNLYQAEFHLTKNVSEEHLKKFYQLASLDAVLENKTKNTKSMKI